MDAYRVRRVRVEDLLRRPMVNEHASGVDDIIRDRTVVITGAGGSIGSELARQVFALGPRRLVLVDRAESPLYLVQRELETRRAARAGQRRAARAPRQRREPGSRCDRLIADEAPSVIFHAAAYKHVPMMEEHPSDAVHVNIGGTHGRCCDAAEAAGVERFVFVSTDKAVRPTSVMGASKRIAEMLVADAARRTGRPYVSVRFGNVLGSDRQRRADLPGAARERRAAHDHPSRHDPLLHDDPGGRLADPRRGRARAATATCSCSTWASRSRSWTWPAT